MRNLLNLFPAPTKKRTLDGCVSLAQRRGFAPLAARPAGQLSIAHFASRVLFFLCMRGKTLVLTRGSHPRILFYSHSPYQTKKTPPWVSFLFGAEKRIRTSGTFQAHTRFPIVLLKPLRHLCINSTLRTSAYLYYCIFLKNASVFTILSKKSLKN